MKWLSRCRSQPVKCKSGADAVLQASEEAVVVSFL